MIQSYINKNNKSIIILIIFDVVRQPFEQVIPPAASKAIQRRTGLFSIVP